MKEKGQKGLLAVLCMLCAVFSLTSCGFLLMPDDGRNSGSVSGSETDTGSATDTGDSTQSSDEPDHSGGDGTDNPADRYSPSQLAAMLAPYEYTVLDNGTYRLDGIKDKDLSQVGIPDCFVEIGDVAFEGCENLLSITIPDTIRTIGYAAFSSCPKLEEAVIPNSVQSVGFQLFSQDVKLERAVLPEALTDLSSGMFTYCISLREVSLPTALTAIGNGTFRYCYALENVDIPSTVESIQDNAFEDCKSLQGAVLPAALKRIGREAFKGCTVLADVDLPQGLTEIGYLAFGGCKNFHRIVLPQSLTTFGDGAFEDCYHLSEVYNLTGIEMRPGWTNNGEVCRYALNVFTDVNQPTCLRTVGDYLYSEQPDGVYLIQYTGEETELTLPNGYLLNGRQERYTLLPSAFRGSALTALTIPSAAYCVSEYAFADSKELREVVVEAGVEALRTGCFQNCEKLQKISLPPSVALGNDLFYGNRALSYLELPDGVQMVDGICSRCPSLVSVVLPASLQRVYENTFADCAALQYVFFKGDESAWANVQISDGGNQALRTATVWFFSEQEPSGSGYYWHYDPSTSLPTVWENALPTE